jgi:hypothetical protein
VDGSARRGARRRRSSGALVSVSRHRTRTRPAGYHLTAARLPVTDRCAACAGRLIASLLGAFWVPGHTISLQEVNTFARRREQDGEPPPVTTERRLIRARQHRLAQQTGNDAADLEASRRTHPAACVAVPLHIGVNRWPPSDRNWLHGRTVLIGKNDDQSLRRDLNRAPVQFR